MRHGLGAQGSQRSHELSDGSAIDVRPIQPEDKRTIEATFDRLSEESRYRRFLTPKNHLSRSELAFLTEVDHSDHEALIGIDAETGDGVGAARYVRSPVDSEVAEVAVSVADDWHGRGVGTALLEELVERAREEGVQRFSALILSENHDVLRLFERVGEVSSDPAGGGQAQIEIELPEQGGIGPVLTRALRGAASRELWQRPGSSLRLGAARLRSRLASMAPDPEVVHGGPIRTILAGSDGSEGAEEAVTAAATLARGLSSRLVLIRARDRLPDTGSESDATTALEVALEEIGRTGVEVTAQDRRGDPASAILDVAEEEEADLIVIGGRGMAGRTRFRLGSVADKVSHHADCSVLIVRPRERTRREVADRARGVTITSPDPSRRREEPGRTRARP